jgi:hypothetical protein
VCGLCQMRMAAGAAHALLFPYKARRAVVRKPSPRGRSAQSRRRCATMARCRWTLAADRQLVRWSTIEYAGKW